MRRMNPELLESIGRRKALMLFRRASRSVPAYRDFLKDRDVDPNRIRTLRDFETLVPLTTKENYVKRYSLIARCVDGRLPDEGTLDESAGTCSSPTNWIHSTAEEDFYSGVNRLSMPYLYNLHRDPMPVVFINGFALGAWAGGQKFSNRMASLGLVKNTGPESGKIICLLREFGSGFRYLIAGYPPFLRVLAEDIASTSGFAWSDYRLDFLTGGEGFVEAWRDCIQSRLGDKVRIYSVYGATDLDVGIAMETPLTVSLKRLLSVDQRIRVSLFGTERLPCYLGQYSPVNFRIGQTPGGDGRGELEITVLNRRTVSPKIRYNIGDEGGVIPFSKLKDSLAEQGRPFESLIAGITDIPIAPLPFVYLFGRSDGTAFFNGALISPNEIEKVLYANPLLTARLNTFKIAVETDKDRSMRLFVYLEMREGIAADESLRMQAERAIVSELQESNDCFRRIFERDPQGAYPRIVLFPYRTGVFAVDNSVMKHRYIARS